jgi:molybdenum cofactor cytidylyltransferase
LLRRQCLCALSANVGPVTVILGFDAEPNRATIADLPVEVRINDAWREGLAASLRTAVCAAREHAAAVLVLPCDQYRIVEDDLRMMRRRWRLTPSTPCISRWADYAGPPAIVPVQYHRRVLELRGETGARSLLWDHGRSPAQIANPRAIFDLDTPHDVVLAEAWNANREADASQE